MRTATKAAACIGLASFTLAACAVVPPTAPMVAAMPGQGKTLEQFRTDDLNCRNYAYNQTDASGARSQQATNSGVATAAVGTALGAAAGALIGAAGGNAGAGAAIGAGSGLLVGSAAGANGAARSQGGLQRAYDVAYSQCMVASGQSVQNVNAPGPAYPPPPAYGYGYAYPGYVAPPAVMVTPGYGGYGPGYGYGWRRPYW